MTYVLISEQARRGTFVEKPLLLAALFTSTISLVFLTFPQIDIAFSNLFYVEGLGFPADKVEALQTLRAIGQYFPLTLSIVMLVGLILKLSYPSRPCLFPPRFCWRYFDSDPFSFRFRDVP